MSSPWRRWQRIGVSLTAVALAASGMLTATTAGASATVRDGGSSANADDTATRLAQGCRQVTAYRVAVYTTATGGTLHGYWYNGTIFQYFRQYGSKNRFETWWPSNVPPSQGTPAWVEPAGTTYLQCPW